MNYSITMGILFLGFMLGGIDGLMAVSIVIIALVGLSLHQKLNSIESKLSGESNPTANFVSAPRKDDRQRPHSPLKKVELKSETLQKETPEEAPLEREPFPWEIELRNAGKKNFADVPILTPSTLKAPIKESLLSTKIGNPRITDKSQKFGIEKFLGAKFFAILGGLSIVLSLGFFLTVAFNSGVIGPVGQLGLGFLVGAGFLIAGELLKSKYSDLYEKITATGIVSLMAVVWIGRHYEFSGLTEPLLGLWTVRILFVLVLLIALGLTLRYKSRLLANSFLISGFALPFLVGSSPSYLLVLPLVTILTFISASLNYRYGWTELTYLSAFFIWIYFTFGGIIVSEGEMSPMYYLVLLFVSGYSVFGAEALKTYNNKNHKTAPVQTIGFVIMTGVVNGLAYWVFENQGWTYFEILLLLQGSLFWLFGSFFESRGNIFYTEVFKSLGLLCLLLSVEIYFGWKSEFMLVGLLASFAGIFASLHMKTQGRFFFWFGIISVCLATLHWFGLNQELGMYSNDLSTLNLFFSGATMGAILVNYGLLIRCADKQGDQPLVLLTCFYLGAIGMILLYSDYFEVPYSLVLLGGFSLLLTLGSKQIKNKIVLNFGVITFLLFVFATLNQVVSLSHENTVLTNLLGWGFFVLVTFVSLIVISRTTLPSQTKNPPLLGIIGGLSSLVTIGFAFEVLENQWGTALIALWGASYILIGKYLSSGILRYVGIGVLLLIIAKLYLIDLWTWDSFSKFIAFGILGGLLIAVAVWYQKEKEE